MLTHAGGSFSWADARRAAHASPPPSRRAAKALRPVSLPRAFIRRAPPRRAGEQRRQPQTPAAPRTALNTPRRTHPLFTPPRRVANNSRLLPAHVLLSGTPKHGEHARSGAAPRRRAQRRHRSPAVQFRWRVSLASSVRDGRRRQHGTCAGKGPPA
jgi:hypothetical protein